MGGVDGSALGAVGAGALVEVGDGLGVGGEHERGCPGAGVASPGVEEQVEQVLPGAGADPVVGQVCFGGGAQLQLAGLHARVGGGQPRGGLLQGLLSPRVRWFSATHLAAFFVGTPTASASTSAHVVASVRQDVAARLGGLLWEANNAESGSN